MLQVIRAYQSQFIKVRRYGGVSDGKATQNTSNGIIASSVPPTILRFFPAVAALVWVLSCLVDRCQTALYFVAAKPREVSASEPPATHPKGGLTETSLLCCME